MRGSRAYGPRRNNPVPPEHPAAHEGRDALPQSELRYRRLFESARDGILILEARAGTIIDAKIFHLRKEDDPAQEKAQAVVERQVGRLILLVDDLLETTRISTGVVPLHLERCEAGEIVRRAIDGINHAVAAQHHELSVSI